MVFVERDELEKAIMDKIGQMSPPSNAGYIEKTTPVVSFGDFTISKIATLGINPSSNEFMGKNGLLSADKKRLADWENGKPADVDVWFNCQNYFRGPNAYWRWFQPLEDLLNSVGASYKENACHLDLSPWATFPSFSQLSPEQQKNLLIHDTALLDWQIIESPIKIVLFNGRKVYETIQSSKNYHLQEIDEFSYRGGGKDLTSKLISGDGPRGESIFGWTVNLQALKATIEEKNFVLSQLSNWLKSQIDLEKLN